MKLFCNLGIHKYYTATTYYPSGLYDTYNLAILHNTECVYCGNKTKHWSDWIFKEQLGEAAHDHAVKVLQDEGYDLKHYFEWLDSYENRLGR